MSMFSKAVSKVTGGIGNFLGGSPGPGNPFGAPNLSFLDDVSKFKYLMDPSSYSYLKDATPYQFLKETPNLTGQGKSFADFYSAPTRSSDAMFEDYIGKINAPSSVEDVQKQVESEQMAQLLSGIDEDTKQSVGSLKMDFADRGLGGPGQISDIESVGLGRTYADSLREKGKVRSDYAGKELERVKAREDAVRQAYGGRYAAGVGFDTQAADIASKGAMSDSQIFNDLLKTETDMGQKGDLAYADLLAKGNQSYADIISGREKTYANILDARDLAKIGQATNLFNAGADRQIAGRIPGLEEYFKRSLGQKLGEKTGEGLFSFLSAPK